MKRILAASTALSLALLLAGCGGDDSDRAGGDSPATPSSDGTAAPDDPTGAGGDDGNDGEGEDDGDDEIENETYASGASVEDFCAALAEIDDAIDEATEGSDADWDRVVAAFDALEEVGVPDDLPSSGIAELTGVDLLVRQSSSVSELNAAAEANPPESGTIDDYIDDNCS